MQAGWYNEVVPPLVWILVTVMIIRKYWPLDYDPECEIYENPAWDMPGYRKHPKRTKPSKAYKARKH